MKDLQRIVDQATRSSRRAVLFDLDGTLIATTRLYLESYRRAIELHAGRRLSDEEMLAVQARSERVMLGACVDAADLDACHATFHQHYDQLHDSHFDGVFPGVVELLAGLRERGLMTGIVTGKSRGAWRATEARTNLGAFDVVVLEDDVRAPKPDPHGITIALESLQVEPQNALYIGDAMTDVQAALAVGVQPVAVLWSKAGPRKESFVRLAIEARVAIIESPHEILTLL